MPAVNPFDPACFDPANASPELREAVEKLSALKIPGLTRALSPEEARAARELGPARGIFQLPASSSQRVESRRIPGPAGELELRCVRPLRGAPRAAMLHIHGGGWFSGSADMMDVGLERRADALGISLASVEYRLAPEHPYPAGPDDCEAAALWLAAHARAELGAELALIGGESAGAHLSAVTLLRMRDRHGFHFAGANLVYGAYDLGGVPSHHQFDDRHLVIDGASIDAMTQMFVPDARRRRDPDVSPLYADLRGLCAALFTVGSFDPLLDHTLFMYAKWIAAGSPAEIQIFPGAPHGFDGFGTAEGARANRRANEFLARCLESRRV